MLNLARLRLLNELSVLGSIAKVAGVVGLTRPAVSQQLAILEQETGTVLFEKSVRGVTLTTAGETLVLQSLKLLEMVREIESDLASAKRTIGGQIRIAAFGSLATTLIPAVIYELMHKFPDLDLRFDELEPIESLKAAAAKQVDLAFVDDSVSAEALSSMLYFRPVFEDHLSLVMASSHPLAGRDSIELAELAKENWALNRNAQTYRAYLLDACHQVGYVPRVVASCRNMAAALELVRTGYVITVLPALALQSAMADSGFAIAPLRPLMVRRIFVAMTQGTFRHPSITAVLRALEVVTPRFQQNPCQFDASKS